MPFERFSMGTELFSMLDKEHDLVDRDFRPFAEECDRMQGIQVFTTIDDAWGGFASSYLESLRDDFPKTTIWTWGLQSPLLDIPRAKRQLRLANTAHSIEQLCTQSSMLVPMALPEEDLSAGISMDRRSPWHTSALMAAAIETATLPSRLAQGPSVQQSSLDILAESLNVNGNQPLASMRMSLAAEKEASEDSRIDVNFFQVGRAWSRQRIGRKDTRNHVFGEITSYRDLDPLENANEGTPGQLAPGERPVIGNSIMRKYVAASAILLLNIGANDPIGTTHLSDFRCWTPTPRSIPSWQGNQISACRLPFQQIALWFNASEHCGRSRRVLYPSMRERTSAMDWRSWRMHIKTGGSVAVTRMMMIYKSVYISESRRIWLKNM
jgi:hypothetical protein